MNWNTLVIVISLLLAAFGVWKEYARANKAHLVLRLISVLVAVAALACIALPLTYDSDVTASNRPYAVLLTDGFNADSLPKDANIKLFTAEKAIHSSYRKAELLAGFDELTTDPGITGVHVYGNGLNEDELQLLNHMPIAFHPAGNIAGVTAISWNEKLSSGEELRLQGTFNNASAKKIKLVLQGLSTDLDSTFIAPNRSAGFELAAVPKNAGKAVYHLLAVAGDDTIEKEDLPVQVESVKSVKIFILPASPGFETRFLKNWLSENGYSVALRTAISKDKFSREFINMPQLPLDNISTQVLSNFDVVIGDLSVLKGFGNAANAALKQEVQQKSLGLIIMADSASGSASWLQSSFPVQRVTGKVPGPVSIVIPGKNGRKAKLNVDGRYISYQNGTQSLVTDDQGRVLAGSALEGSGKLIFTTLNNTFNWMLAGDKDDYTALWSALITKTARKTKVTERWSVASMPFVNSPVRARLESGLRPTGININGAVVSPMQNPAIPFEWNSLYWPTATGWLSAQQDNGTINWWYAYDSGEWKGVIATAKTAATKKYAAENPIGVNVTKQIHQKMRIAIPKIYFYMLILLACAFLWIEAKMTLTINKR